MEERRTIIHKNSLSGKPNQKQRNGVRRKYGVVIIIQSSRHRRDRVIGVVSEVDQQTGFAGRLDGPMHLLSTTQDSPTTQKQIALSLIHI